MAVDVGAQWVGPGQTRAPALVEALGLELWAQLQVGRKILDVRSNLRHFRGNIPALPILSLVAPQLTI